MKTIVKNDAAKVTNLEETNADLTFRVGHVALIARQSNGALWRTLLLGFVTSLLMSVMVMIAFYFTANWAEEEGTTSLPFMFAVTAAWAAFSGLGIVLSYIFQFVSKNKLDADLQEWGL